MFLARLLPSRSNKTPSRIHRRGRPSWGRQLAGIASRGRSRALTVEPLEDRMLLTAYVVNTPLDNPSASPDDMDGRVSLREAVTAASTNAPFGDAPAGQGDGLVDSITFRASLKGKTIVLGGAELTVSDHLSITGLGSDKLTISGNNASRVFSIAPGVAADILRVTIADGNAYEEGIAVEGGGIYNQGALTVANCTLTNNSAYWDGGAIYNLGTLIVVDSILSGNSAACWGGAICNYSPDLEFSSSVAIMSSTLAGNNADEGGGIWSDGLLNIANSTFSGNDAAGDGGGICSDGSLNVTDSNFSENSSQGSGGAIYNNGTLDISNCTFSGNETRINGGGIANPGGSLTVAGSTFSENSAHTGGGIDNWGGQIQVSNSIFADNKSDTGAAIWNQGPASITDSRFVANRAKWWGGAIVHHTYAMTVTNCAFEGNRSGNWSGAIFSSSGATLKVLNTTFSGNSTGYEGGAIENWVSTLEIANSTISGNSTDGVGGGIYSYGSLTITNSTISDNKSGDEGGGIWNKAVLHITNSTISGNKSNSDGGGIWNLGSLTITNSTIFGNRADADGNGSGSGGGLYNVASASYPSSVLNNTILGGNVRGKGRTRSPDDISGAVDPASAHNLIGDAATAGGLVDGGENGNILGNAGVGTIDMDSVLDPNLADNGGPTWTHALVAGSLALNAGDNFRAVNPEGNLLDYDQRGEGFARVCDGNVDIGAFEVQSSFVQFGVELGSGANSVCLADAHLIVAPSLTSDSFEASLGNARDVALAEAGAVDNAVEDSDHDFALDRLLHFQVEDVNLDEIYSVLPAQDADDGILDSNFQSAAVSLTSRTAIDECFARFDDVDLLF